MRFDNLRWYHVFFAAAVLISAAAVLPSGDDIGLSRGQGTAAVIPLEGPISFSSGPSQSAVTPDTVRSLTQQAQRDGVDAIIYDINSGGGAVVASREIARIVEQVDVPTVCRMKEVAASGAYWVAAACDRIVADPLTTTGSLGVTSAYLEYSGLLRKLGVEYVNLTAGEYKDMGSPFKNLTADERAKFEGILDTVHASFIDYVAEQRNLSTAAVRDVATGELLLGETAQAQGLVDELGGKEEAVDAAEELAGIPTLQVREYTPPRQLSVLSLLFSQVGKGIASGFSGSDATPIQAR